MLQGIPSLMVSQSRQPLLLDSLVSYWKLDETSGTRVDSHTGGNDLTDNNTVGSATGIINDGANFILPNNEFLSHINNSSLQVTSDFTFSCWVKCQTSPTNPDLFPVIAKGDLGSGTTDYMLYIHPTAGFVFTVNDPLTVGATPNSALSTGTWYNALCWYDSGTQKASIRVNDDTTFTSPAGTVALVQTTKTFILGTRDGASPPYMSGIIDEVGFWKRLLTAGEITQLYNSGAGLAYPFT